MLDVEINQRLLLDVTFLCITAVHLIADKYYVGCILTHQIFGFHTQTCIATCKLFAYLQTLLLGTDHPGTFHYELHPIVLLAVFPGLGHSTTLNFRGSSRLQIFQHAVLPWMLPMSLRKSHYCCEIFYKVLRNFAKLSFSVSAFLYRYLPPNVEAQNHDNSGTDTSQGAADRNC